VVSVATWIAIWWLVGRPAAIRAVIARLVIVVVGVIGVLAVVAVVPVKHALALLEVVGDVVYALLPGCEAVLAESTLARELSLGANDARLFVRIDIDAGMDISKVLCKMVLAKTGLDVINALVDAEAAHPRFAGVPKRVIVSGWLQVWSRHA
jgi:hypothetical protein